ncbi:amidase family protein, partial [Bradyrhizobium japonicum]|uniref:amidase family protein n=1 Tax=Bradyrhizobium japonicum TaxID=375 RepID=UPI002413F528
MIAASRSCRRAGGSSAGSAVAVAAGLCAASIGTETSGSLLYPASQNGLVTVKPTVGLVSRAGIVPIAHSQDTAGPMTRTVRDAAMLLNVLAA